MKALKDHARSALVEKLARLGGKSAKPTTKHPARSDFVRSFASGGAVSDVPVEGASAKPRFGRGIKKGGKKDAKTNVNVVVMPKADKPAAPDMPPMMAPPPAMPVPPMRKTGGKVNAFAKGGRVRKADGGRTPGDEMSEARARRDQAQASARKSALIAASNLLAGSGAALFARKSGVAKSLLAANALGAGLNSRGTVTSNADAEDAQRVMDRIGRRPAVDGEEDRKRGGRVKKADGGSAEPSRRSDEQLRRDIEAEPSSLGNPNAILLGAGIGALIRGATASTRVGRALGPALGAAATAKGGQGLIGDFGNMKKSVDAKAEFRRRAAVEGEEDRKSGGRVGRKAGGGAYPLDAAAGGGKGRLEKIKAYDVQKKRAAK